MKVSEWSKSNIDYGRKLLDSGLEGARSGEGEFLQGERLAPFIEESARHALEPATIGVFLGVLSSYTGNGHKSTSRILAYGLLGGAIGFGIGVAWGNRRLAASVASSAMKSMGKVRDEHWLENNPIDYA
jgi:threonine/homoserine/homoserine lactone efflux protein